MNLSEAKLIYRNQEATEHWMELDEQVREDLIDLQDWYDARQTCCEPYDCMCHEQCHNTDDPSERCYGCQEGARLHDATDKVDAEQYKFALAIREMDRYSIQRYELDTIKMLEESGDYAAAARMFSGEDE